MRFTTFIAVAGLTMLAGAAFAGNTTYDYDKSTDFTTLKTYAWAPGAPLGDELTHHRVMAAFDAQLSAKGLRRVDPTRNPDMLVAYDAGVDPRVRLEGYGSRFGPSSLRAERVLHGMLVFEMVNARSGATVWRGMASREIDPGWSPETREKKLAQVAEKILKKYPTRADASGAKLTKAQD